VKVLVIEHEDAGCGLAFCLRCIKVGHQVRYWLRPGNNTKIGEGFPGLTKIDNWVSSLKWADLVWCTGNDQFIPKLDYAKSQGVCVFAPSVRSTELEVKRAKGMKFLEKHGVDVPEYQQFTSLKDAEAHQRKHDERFVFKTLGDNEDKSLSYVGKTPADMVARLQRWQRLAMNPKGPVMLQRFIEGVEFGVSRWVGSDGFIGLYNEHFEHKKLLSGDCGPNCGESGTVQKYADDSTLGEMILAPLEDAIIELGHLGDIAINCIIDSHGKPWPLEFTCRAGWPAMNIMLATHQGDPAEWMRDACKGRDTLKVTTAIAAGVVVAQPDYPYSKLTKAETLDIPIYGVTDKNRRFIAPQSVKMATLPQMVDGKVAETPMWATCGDYVAVVTGVGKSVRRACQLAYRVIEQLSIPNMIYRDDIGEKLEKELPLLQSQGFAEEFTYG
jgi:phosphoribosylamine---glycine ligase